MDEKRLFEVLIQIHVQLVEISKQLQALNTAVREFTVAQAERPEKG